MSTHLLMHNQQDTVCVATLECVTPGFEMSGWVMVMDTDDTIRLPAVDSMLYPSA